MNLHGKVIQLQIGNIFQSRLSHCLLDFQFILTKKNLEIFKIVFCRTVIKPISIKKILLSLPHGDCSLFCSYQVETDKFDILWAMVGSVFGIEVIDHHDQDYNKSSKILIFISFLAGSIFFYSYQAFLTSSLAVPSETVPFRTPEEILQTNYR